MTNCKLWRVFLMTSVVLGACAPMEQAPLVYVSTVKVGVNVSTTATSASGLDMTIGVNQTDAAYVPVLAAKHCKFEAAADCNKPIYESKQIAGQNSKNDGTPPSSDEVKLAAAQFDAASSTVTDLTAKLADANQAYADGQKKLAAVTSAQTALAKAKTDQTSLSDTASDEQKTATAKTVSDAETALVTAQRQAVDGNGNPWSQSGLDALQKAQTALQTQLAQAKKDASDALTKLQVASNSNAKQDAYSVFGTFSGSANTGVTGQTAGTAVVTLGKTFSTGVAAQNLTEGIAGSSNVTAISTCLTSADALLKTAGQNANADSFAKLVAICAGKSL